MPGIIMKRYIVVQCSINRSRTQSIGRQSIQKALAVENPNNAIAVSITLNTVTICVPNFFVRRSDIKLEQMVPPEIIIVTRPA